MNILNTVNYAINNGCCWCLVGSVVSDSLQPHGLQPARLLCPWDSPGRNPGVGCRVLLQGIFLTQGLNLGLLYWRRVHYHLSHTVLSFFLSSFFFSFHPLFLCFLSSFSLLLSIPPPYFPSFLPFMQQAGSYFSNQGGNPCPLHWEAKS